MIVSIGYTNLKWLSYKVNIVVFTVVLRDR
jgi:hypothetical protein